MKLALVVATVAVAANAAKQSVLTLNAEEMAVLGAELAEWRQEFGAEAQALGLIPKSSKAMTSEATLVDQLQRLLNTKFEVAAARAANPLAEFTHKHKFALLSPQEFGAYVKGMSGDGHRHLRSLETVSFDDVVQADSIDWTTSSNCVSPVRNQGSCGSCWAFSTVGVVESAHCIATGQLLDLAEQQVTSCSTNGGSQGCSGGWPWYAIDWMTNGACLEQEYPYVAQTGTCKTSCTKQKLAIGKHTLASGESALTSALNTQPVSVTVEAGNSVWQNYKSGVVTRCPGAQLDHAVIAVGYDATSYKIKNSWGANWGDNGYIRLQRNVGGKGMCNVVENVAFPQINAGPTPPVPTSSGPTLAPKPSTTAPVTPVPSPGDKCGTNHNVCLWPLTGQVVPYTKDQCLQFSGSFVWCP